MLSPVIVLPKGSGQVGRFKRKIWTVSEMRCCATWNWFTIANIIVDNIIEIPYLWCFSHGKKQNLIGSCCRKGGIIKTSKGRGNAAMVQATNWLMYRRHLLYREYLLLWTVRGSSQSCPQASRQSHLCLCQNAHFKKSASCVVMTVWRIEENRCCRGGVQKPKQKNDSIHCFYAELYCCVLAIKLIRSQEWHWWAWLKRV